MSNLLSSLWVTGSETVGGLTITLLDGCRICINGTYTPSTKDNTQFVPAIEDGGTSRPSSWGSQTVLFAAGDTYTLTATEVSGTLTATSTNSFNLALGANNSGNGAVLQVNLADSAGPTYTASATTTLGITNLRLYIKGGCGIVCDNYTFDVVLTGPTVDHTVTFNAQGGSSVASQTIEDGQTATEPTAPTRAHYTFGGWYTDTACTTAYDFTVAVTADLTLYAKWTRSEYIVTFESNSGSSVTAQTVAVGSAATEPTAPIRAHYTFAGWYSDSGLSTAWDFATVITADITLYAKWTAITWTVTFETNGGSSVVPQTINDGDTATKPSAPTQSGYLFAGWYSDSGLSTAWDFSTVITANVTLYAKWTESAGSYTVTFVSNGGTAVDSVTAEAGSVISAPTEPTREHYAFGGWYKEAALTTAWNFATDTVAANTTLYAAWTRSEYEVTFDTRGGTAVPSQWVTAGGVATSPGPAPTKEGAYQIYGWYTDAALTTYWSFASDTVTTDMTLYARWMYYLTFELDGGSGSSGFPVGEGDTFEYQAGWTPYKQHYSFVGWYYDSAFTQPITMTDTITQAVTLWAKYEPIYFTLTFDSQGGTAVPSQQVFEGDYAAEPAETPTKDGYYFGGWFGCYDGTTLLYPELNFPFTQLPFYTNYTTYAKWLKAADPVPTLPTVHAVYCAHLADIGWTAWEQDGATAGTVRQERQAEAIMVKVTGNAALGVTYSVHLADIGWTANVSDGAQAGTTGESRQLEAVKITLTGADASKYHIYYRLHMRNVGWGAWARDGSEAGTTGKGLRAEAIQIYIEPKATVGDAWARGGISVYLPGNTSFKNGVDYDGTGAGVGTADASLSLATSCRISEELNGAWSLRLAHPTDNSNVWKMIVADAVLRVRGPEESCQLYRIKYVEVTDTFVYATAQPIFLDARDDVFLLDVRPTNLPGGEALAWLMKGQDKYGIYTFQGPEELHTAYYVRKNLIEAISGSDENAFLNVWGGEIAYYNYMLYVTTALGKDEGVVIRYGKDLKSIRETTSHEDLITRIIPVAYNGYMLDGDEPWVDSGLLDHYPVVYNREVKFDDIKLQVDCDEEGAGYETMAELQTALASAAAAKYTYEDVDKPAVTLEIDFVQLRNTQDYPDYQSVADLRLGDALTVKHSRLGIDLTMRVTGIEWDVIRQQVDKVTLGNFPKNFRYFNHVNSAVMAAEEALDVPNGTVKAEQVRGTIDASKASVVLRTDVTTSANTSTNAGDAQEEANRLNRAIAIAIENQNAEDDDYGTVRMDHLGIEFANIRTGMTLEEAQANGDDPTKEWDTSVAINTSGCQMKAQNIVVDGTNNIVTVTECNGNTSTYAMTFDGENLSGLVKQ